MNIQNIQVNTQIIGKKGENLCIKGKSMVFSQVSVRKSTKKSKSDKLIIVTQNVKRFFPFTLFWKYFKGKKFYHFLIEKQFLIFCSISPSI